MPAHKNPHYPQVLSMCVLAVKSGFFRSRIVLTSSSEDAPLKESTIRFGSDP